MAYCDRSGREVELEEQEPGVLVCPECGERLDADSLATVTQAHTPDEEQS